MTRDERQGTKMDCFKEKALFVHIFFSSRSLYPPSFLVSRLSSLVSRISIPSRGLVAPTVARPVDCSRVRVRESKTKLELKLRPQWFCFLATIVLHHLQDFRCDLPPECDTHTTVCTQGGATDCIYLLADYSRLQQGGLQCV